MREIIEIVRQNKNTKLYLIFSFLQSFWIIEAAWYFYWGNFLTYTQVGLVFTWLTILALIAEVPTGVFADKFGRRKTVIFGSSLLALGGTIMSLAGNATWLVIGCSLMTTGRAFNSGALEALVYDSLKEQGLAKMWDKLASKKLQLSLIAYMIAVPIGGFLYTVFFRLPNMIEAVTWILIVIIASRFSEKKIIKENKSGLQIVELSKGFRELLSFRLRPFIFPAFMVITIFELYDWGLSKPAMAASYGLDSRGQAVVYMLLSMINVISVGWMPKIRAKLGDYWGLRIINLISAGAFIVSGYLANLWGIATMMMIELAGNIGDPWVSTAINAHTDSKYRATTLSSLSFAAMLPQVVVNIFAGQAVDGSGIGNFHIYLGLIILVFVTVSIKIKQAVNPTHQPNRT